MGTRVLRFQHQILHREILQLPEIDSSARSANFSRPFRHGTSHVGTLLCVGSV